MYAIGIHLRVLLRNPVQFSDLNLPLVFLMAVDGFFAGTNEIPMRWFVSQTLHIQMLVAPASSFQKASA
jgi:hypothetical protein